MARMHHGLKVWQEAITLVQDVYIATANFPVREIYALSNQMRRAAVSIPSNIAEGAARSGSKEFNRFLSMARGSLSELETQAILSRELGYLRDSDSLVQQIERVFALLGGLMNQVQNRSRN